MADSGAEKPSDGLKRIAKGDLDEIVRLHHLLVSSQPGGRRALLAFYDLTSVDLSGRDLPEADFTGARLARARLRAANLRFAILFGADLRTCNLQGADLNSCRFAGRLPARSRFVRRRAGGSRYSRGHAGPLHERRHHQERHLRSPAVGAVLHRRAARRFDGGARRRRISAQDGFHRCRAAPNEFPPRRHARVDPARRDHGGMQPRRRKSDPCRFAGRRFDRGRARGRAAP